MDKYNAKRTQSTVLPSQIVDALHTLVHVRSLTQEMHTELKRCDGMKKTKQNKGTTAQLSALERTKEPENDANHVRLNA